MTDFEVSIREGREFGRELAQEMVRRLTMVAGATPESGLERVIDRIERRLKAMQARHVPRALVAAWAEAVEDAYQERLTELTLFADPQSS